MRARVCARVFVCWTVDDETIDRGFRRAAVVRCSVNYGRCTALGWRLQCDRNGATQTSEKPKRSLPRIAATMSGDVPRRRPPVCNNGVATCCAPLQHVALASVCRDAQRLKSQYHNRLHTRARRER
jgi:hypothetical protein